MTKLEALVAAMQAARPTTTKAEALTFISTALPRLNMELWDGPANDMVVQKILQEARSSRVADLGVIVQQL